MAEWFECKIKYERTMDNGLVKKVNEPYLVDALNFTEAERRIIKEVAPFMSGEFQVSDIKRARFAEIFETSDDAADRWYKAKLSFITLDEKSGKEKKTSHNMLVQASDLRDAVKRLDEGMKGSMMDYEIAAVSETSIMDVFHYKADDVPERVKNKRFAPQRPIYYQRSAQRHRLISPSSRVPFGFFSHTPQLSSSCRSNTKFTHYIKHSRQMRNSSPFRVSSRRGAARSL